MLPLFAFSIEWNRLDELRERVLEFINGNGFKVKTVVSCS